MASWKRARSADREAAVETINAAYADGQIDLAEREDKVARALAARTLGEVQQTTADLQGPRPVASAPRKPSSPEEPQRRPSRRMRAAVVAGVVLVGGGLLLALGQDSSEDPSTDSADSEAAHVAPRQVTVDADLLADLVRSYESTFSTTRTFGFIVHPAWVRVQVPTQDGNARYVQWTLVGEDSFGNEEDAIGAGELREFDIADLDVEALSRTIDRARTGLRVEDPTRVAVEIRHWSYDDEPSVAVMVSNVYEESGHLVTDLGGKVLTRVPYRSA